MSLITVRLEDADDPDADLPVSFQLMGAVPPVGDRLWLGGPRDEYEVVTVTWRLRKHQSSLEVNAVVDLTVRRIIEPAKESTATEVDAVVVGGRIVAVDDLADPYLLPGQVAAWFGVPPAYPSRWMRAYGPDHALPYPAHMPGRFVIVDGQMRVLASALDEWAAAVGVGKGATA